MTFDKIKEKYILLYQNTPNKESSPIWIPLSLFGHNHAAHPERVYQR